MESRVLRPRICKGILVASTNPIINSMIRGRASITIMEYYRPISFKRVSRKVIN